MPPLDLGSLVSCDGGGAESSKAAPSGGTQECDDPYAPAPSLRLRIGEDIDWCDVGAGAVLERDDSTKGAGANPKSTARRSVAAASARTSLSGPAAPRAVAVVVIGGLPASGGKGKAARDHGRRRSSCGLGCRARVFASGEVAVVGQLMAEPGSPKVSCLGGVRSQPRPAAEGISGRRWWVWRLAADAMSCCWNGGRRDGERRPRGGEAE